MKIQNISFLQSIIIYTLLILSIWVIVAISFLPELKIPLLFNLNPSTLNRVIEALSLAYISSFIFYIVVVKLKETEVKRTITPFIADNTYVLLNNQLFFLHSMRHCAGVEQVKFNTGIYNRNLQIYPSDKILKEICKSINPNEEYDVRSTTYGFTVVPHFYGKMIHFTHRIDYFLELLLAKSQFIDIRLLRILTDIKASGYHFQMSSYGQESVFSAKHRHDNIEVFYKSFKYYFDLFKELEEYADKNLKRYVQREALKKKG